MVSQRRSVPDLDLSGLAGLPDLRREVFEARLERWLPDLYDAVEELYDDPASVVRQLVALAVDGYAERDDELHRLDLRRSLAPDWFQRPDLIGYAAYADRFATSCRC